MKSTFHELLNVCLPLSSPKAVNVFLIALESTQGRKTQRSIQEL